MTGQRDRVKGDSLPGLLFMGFSAKSIHTKKAFNFATLTWKWFWWRKLGVAAGSVHATDLDEASHEHDERDSHQ